MCFDESEALNLLPFSVPFIKQPIEQMAKQALKDHKIFSSLLMIGAFTSSYFFQIHTVLIIITLALIGLVVFTLFDEKEVK